MIIHLQSKKQKVEAALTALSMVCNNIPRDLSFEVQHADKQLTSHRLGPGNMRALAKYE